MNENHNIAKHILRVYMVLGAIEVLDRPYLRKVAQATGIPARTVNDILAKVKAQYGVIIKKSSGYEEKRTTHYHILDWGFLNQEKVANCFLQNRPSTSKTTDHPNNSQIRSQL